MASFEEIMKRPASESKPPQPLPPGTYHCIVDGPPEYQESSQKKVPCKVYKYKIVGFSDDVDARAATEQQAIGKILNGQAIGTAFYINDEGSHRYREFLEHVLGIENPDGKRSFEEMEMEAKGRQLYVKLKLEPSQDGKRVFNKVESTMHV